MLTEKYRIKGMHCASCSSIIEKTLKKQDGVQSAEANFGTENVKIVFDESITDPLKLAKKIEPLGYTLILPVHNALLSQEGGQIACAEISKAKQDKLAELALLKARVLIAIPFAVFSTLVKGWDILAQFNIVAEMSAPMHGFTHHLLLLFAFYTLFVIGKPYLLGFYRFLRYGKANTDTLVGIGTLIAFIYSFIVMVFKEPLMYLLNVEYTYFDVTIVVIAFVVLGEYLEAKAKIRTGDAIEKLLNLQSTTALIMRDEQEQEIAINQVALGDYIVVKPGVRIPVDGVITEGTSFIDESMVTGEPMPVEKNIGDTVSAGTINTTGSFIFQATQIGEATLLARIIKMVEEAEGSRAPIQSLVDKIAGVFVPVVVVLAFIAFGSWLLFGMGTLGFTQAFSFGLVSFVSILIIACPCALGLATPTAIIVGVGKGASEGILIKDAATLEKLHGVNTVIVDKTGTITKGKPEFISMQNISKLSDEKALSILAALEAKSEHPIAHTITAQARAKNLTLPLVSNFEALKGRGVKAFIDDKEYFAGNAKLISELGIAFDMSNIEEGTLRGETPIILATKNEIIMMVMVADIIKQESVTAIKDLHNLGIKTVMLTGDHKNTAFAIARQVGIDDVVFEASPQDKLNKIKELQNQGLIVAMAGDGINDAPALAQADIGIAMGTGADAAIETAGITLLNGDMSKLVKAIRLSKFTMRGIKQNLFWASIYNLIAIPLAGGAFYPILGWLLNPVFAGFAMAFSSISVVGNSLRLKSKKL